MTNPCRRNSRKMKSLVSPSVARGWSRRYWNASRVMAVSRAAASLWSRITELFQVIARIIEADSSIHNPAAILCFCDRQGQNIPGARRAQGKRGLQHRGAGGHYIVQKDDIPAADLVGRTDPETTGDVRVPRAGPDQAALRRRVPRADQYGGIHRNRHLDGRRAGDKLGLIETAFPCPPPTQIHRQDT